MHSTDTARLSNANKVKPAGSDAGNVDSLAPHARHSLLRKVLVVDDQHDLADMTGAMLSLHGLEVLVSYSAKEALQALQAHDDIDALLSDVVMPGMTGVELAEAVREMYPAVKIILTSGYALPALLANHEKPYLYTAKPYTIETVLRLLQT